MRIEKTRKQVYYMEERRIKVIRASVVTMKVDAIVNAANNHLLGGGGVDGAIHKAAGPELLKECRVLHGCETGDAKITGAYKIKNAKYIIHTVGPIYSATKQDAKLLASCYEKSLNLALENNCKSIAFPGISTGVYGYPLKEAAKISYNTVNNWLKQHEGIKMEVYFCCFRQEELEAYQRVIIKEKI